MDYIIDELIDKYKLSDYEALIAVGILGIVADTENIDIDKIIFNVSNKLKPILTRIIKK